MGTLREPVWPASLSLPNNFLVFSTKTTGTSSGPRQMGMASNTAKLPWGGGPGSLGWAESGGAGAWQVEGQVRGRSRFQAEEAAWAENQHSVWGAMRRFSHCWSTRNGVLERSWGCRSFQVTKAWIQRTMEGLRWVSVSWGSCNRAPDWEAYTTEMYCLPALEAVGQKRRRWGQAWVPLRAAAAGNRWCLLACRCNTLISAYIFTWGPSCVCVGMCVNPCSNFPFKIWKLKSWWIQAQQNDLFCYCC